jgi:hypothetical protein
MFYFTYLWILTYDTEIYIKKTKNDTSKQYYTNIVGV